MANKRPTEEDRVEAIRRLLAGLLRGDEVHRVFPFFAPDTVAALHVRRAGWMNAVALGSWLFKRALASGARFVSDSVMGVKTAGGRVREVHLASGDVISTERFVIAAGPAPRGHASTGQSRREQRSYPMTSEENRQDRRDPWRRTALAPSGARSASPS